MANNAMGYIIIDGTETQIRGAALVTDAKGFPVDFVRSGYATTQIFSHHCAKRAG